MGVQCLTKFVKTRAIGKRRFLTDFAHTTFFIDGHSLLYALATNLDWRFGGELETIKLKIYNFCQKLKYHNIQISVYIDGEKNNFKKVTNELRQSKRLLAISSAYGKKECDTNTILPPTAMNVFINTLLKINCNVKIVHGEADGVLCYDAYINNGTVCSDDSDCLIYECPQMIFITDLLQCDNTVLIYNRTHLAYSLGYNFKLSWLPIFGTLCGNDFTRDFSDPIISHIVQHIKYGYFIMKIAKYIIQNNGNVNSIIDTLFNNQVITKEQSQIMLRSINMYETSGTNIPVKTIYSIQDDYLYTMFLTLVKSTFTRKCYLPIVPHDINDCPFNIWSKTVYLRQLVYSLLYNKNGTVTEYFQNNNKQFTVKYNEDIPAFYQLNTQRKLQQLSQWVLNTPDSIWYKKRKKNRMYKLACLVCSHILENNQNWKVFEHRMDILLSKAKQNKTSELTMSAISNYYGLFQVVTMHLNLLSGILGLYNHLPPFLDFGNGSYLCY